MAEEGRLRREGRAIFYRLGDEDADYPGEEVLLARIPDHLTPEEWEWLFDPAATLEDVDRG